MQEVRVKDATKTNLTREMTMEVWTWNQPVDRNWKVISDRERGTILVYNEKNELILEKQGLNREAVTLIEDNFFKIVADNLAEEKPELLDNPMYI